ncbi:conserved hypothetical protein [Pseudomonas sp. OF001]|uniref:BRCT domain-containing protein n=1 Tax=Pseudomonas sp. OF001 TaxID=2772300 RepID=UPI001919E5E8|nr:BRCT domain-containing protein [Pseudomonas sp. OF001]CAD5377124.1 conserved hypothetical protein [Pseudomonas sp. OF001]
MVDLHQEFQETRIFHAARMDRRAADMLVGLVTGIVADGVVTQQEATHLRDWMNTHLAQLNDPVINTLFRRIHAMLLDQALDADEAADLLDTLRSFIGYTSAQPAPRTYTAPTTLPLDNPAPDLTPHGRVFVFTGVMAFGPRKDCEAVVIDRGGLAAPSITKKTHFLVVGSIGNEQWLQSTYGRKIMRAVELRDAGCPLAIVSEDHWQKTLLG